mgnify:CR=1 FL=1
MANTHPKRKRARKNRQEEIYMAYKNKYDKGGNCSVMGHRAEGTFSNLAEVRGFNIQEATRQENMHEHWDFALDRWGDKDDDLVYMLVDVKARKKTRRKDTKFNDEWVWLEFKNVQGHNGWLKGNATHIAFEREHDFVLAPRKNLWEWANKEIKRRNGVGSNATAANARDARYKYYTRWQRKDVLSQVHMQDMMEGVKDTKVWKKT